MNNITPQEMHNIALAWAFMLIAGPFCLAAVIQAIEGKDDSMGTAYFYALILNLIAVLAYAAIKFLRWIT